MSGPGELPSKHEIASALLLRGTVFVHLDPRAVSVVVPAWLKKQPQLVLQVGLDMPLPIPDLRLDSVGVYGTLSFNRTACTCSVPWEAVFALAGDDGRGMVWPASMPEEIAAEVQREARRVHALKAENGATGADALPARLRARVAKPALHERPAATAEAVAKDRISEPKAKTRPRRELPPYLRVIK